MKKTLTLVAFALSVALLFGCGRQSAPTAANGDSQQRQPDDLESLSLLAPALASKGLNRICATLLAHAQTLTNESSELKLLEAEIRLAKGNTAGALKLAMEVADTRANDCRAGESAGSGSRDARPRSITEAHRQVHRPAVLGQRPDRDVVDTGFRNGA